MYPHFTLCHIVVCTLNARIDLGSGKFLNSLTSFALHSWCLQLTDIYILHHPTGSLYFSRRHPLACWLSTLLSIFSSTILTNFLLNEPVVSALGNTQQVLWASGVWYLIFYSPFDIVYKFCSFMPIKITLYCMNEIFNCKAIYQGILHASKIFPDSYVVMAFIGIIKGNGPGFTKMLERLVRGTWSLSVLEFMNPSYTTKVSTLATITFILNKYIEWLMISHSFVFFCVVLVCIYFRLSAILLDMNDPFAPLENFICLLLFGGIWDALARAIAVDDRSHHPQSSYLRARAMKVDMLSRDGRVIVEKATIINPQVSKF